MEDSVVVLGCYLHNFDFYVIEKTFFHSSLTKVNKYFSIAKNAKKNLAKISCMRKMRAWMNSRLKSEYF